MNPETIDLLSRLPPPPSTVPGRFTIAIPTFNRATFLRRSLRAALSQAHKDVEVLVCDNASTDDTRAVVSEFGSRVRYYCHDRNRGAVANWELAPNLATGEYFSWLQDDDLIHREFASRAGAALEASEVCRVYSCYLAYGSSDTTYISQHIYGAGLPLDWQAGATRSFGSREIAAVGFFHNLGLPPGLAFRTSAIREGLLRLPSDCDLYVERLIPLVVAGDGSYVVEPWLGGLFFSHEHQYSRALIKSNLSKTHWIAMARRLGEIIQAANDDSWIGFMTDLFRQMSVADRINWLRDEHTASIDWRAVHPVAHLARTLLIDSLPAAARERTKKRSGFREVVKECVPPLILKTAFRMRNYFRAKIYLADTIERSQR